MERGAMTKIVVEGLSYVFIVIYFRGLEQNFFAIDDIYAFLHDSGIASLKVVGVFKQDRRSNMFNACGTHHLETA